MTWTHTTRRRNADDGVSLIEVLVAVLVFAIVSTGIVAGMTTIARLTTDMRARVTAANLASQDIDLARAISDPFGITDQTTVYPVDGRDYTVKRSTSWVSRAGADVSCSSGTNLMYLRVNIRVTWPDMLSTTKPVQDDTLIAPAGRITDTSSGAIGVSVTGAANDVQTGVSVTVTPTTGGSALTAQPGATNGSGCTYANQVAPGTYDVKISKAGWISSDQQATVTKSVTVSAGTTQSPAFPPYAQAATFTNTYVAGPVAYTSSFAVPTNLETTWTNTAGTWTTTGATAARFPYTTGYGVIAGLTQSGSQRCASTDPQAWSAGISNGVPLAAGVRGTASAAAGESATAPIPVGVVLVKAPAGVLLGATQATPATGAPSCAISGSVYYFPGTATGAWQAVALPYGSWHIGYGTSLSNAQFLGPASIQIKTNAASSVVAADGTVTLDPRGLR